MSWWKRPGLWWLGLWITASFLVGWIFPNGAQSQNSDAILLPPSPAHLFGTDSLGRDLCARLLEGTKISLAVGLCSAAVALSLGIFVGALAGWRGGWLERTLMSLTDLAVAVPGFIFVAVFTLALQEGLPWDEGILKSVLSLSVAIGLSHWMIPTRVTRAMVRQARHLTFVEAARSLGASDARIWRSHLWPNLKGPLWTLFALQIPTSLLYESFMSFIGLGVQAPQVSWGVLIQEGRTQIASHPHLILFPALVLFLTVWTLQSLFERSNVARSTGFADRLRL